MVYDSLILSPYVYGDQRRLGWNSAWLSLAAVFFLSAMYGLFVGLFVQTLIAVCLVLPAALVLLVLWAMPATDRIPEKSMEFLLFASLVALIVWPNYLALALPGMPWITLMRLIEFPLLCVLLYCAFASARFRAQLRIPLAASPWLTSLFVAFICLQLLSVAVSINPLQSLNKFLLVQIGWTSVFFVACYVFLKPGRAQLWAAMVWLTAVVVALMGLLEYQLGHVLWAGHIPAFLKIEDPIVQRILSPHIRAYTGRYRSVSTFSTPLGFAEYLAYALPFILQFAATSRRFIVRLAAVLTVPLVIYVVLQTDSRLGMVGCLLALVLYGLFWSIWRWRRNPRSIFGPAIALAYPLIIVGSISLTFVSHRMHAVVWGSDASEIGSTQARGQQLDIAILKVQARPWGYGMYMGAETVGWRTPGGNLTLDSYYITILVEYGVLGFIVFYGMFATAILAAGRRLLASSRADPELDLLLPAMLTLVNFVVIKSVLSQDEMQPVIFMAMAMILALIARQMMDSGSQVLRRENFTLLTA